MDQTQDEMYRRGRVEIPKYCCVIASKMAATLLENPLKYSASYEATVMYF